MEPWGPVLGVTCHGCPGTPIRRSPSGVLSPGSHIRSPLLEVEGPVQGSNPIPEVLPRGSYLGKSILGSLPRVSPKVQFPSSPKVPCQGSCFGGPLLGSYLKSPILASSLGVWDPVLGSPLRVQPGGPVILGVISHPMIPSKGHASGTSQGS